MFIIYNLNNIYLILQFKNKNKTIKNKILLKQENKMLISQFILKIIILLILEALLIILKYLYKKMEEKFITHQIQI